MKDKSRFKTQYNIFMRITSYLSAYRGRYIIGGFAASFEIALSLIMPYLYEQLVAVASLSDGNSKAIYSVLILLGVLILLTPVVCWGSYNQYVSAAYATGELRKHVFSHIQKLSISETMERHTGDYVMLLSNDVERAGFALRGFAITSLFRFVVMFTFSGVLLFLREWRMGVFSLVFCILYFYTSITLNPKARAIDRQAQEYSADTASFLIETVKSLPIIRVFLLKKRFAGRYRQLCEEIKRLRVRYLTINGIVGGLIFLFQFAAQPIAFLFGIYLVIHGQLSVGSLVFMAGLVGVMADAIKSLSSFIANIQNGLVSGQRIFSLLDTPIEEERITQLPPDMDADIIVEFNNVHFSYPGTAPVIRGLSAHIRRGQVVALVGTSGGGKTTLIKLLLNFYEPDVGSIALFGRPLKDLSRSDIRALSAYVPQEATIFDATIAENIGLGDPSATRSDIENAAKKAYIHDFIMELPKGYDTPVGERGTQLSGGQRQRIAIARAMLKDAPLLLLDEATSALDSQSETEVIKALGVLMEGRTTLVVAHRLSTIRHADLILVIDGGVIAESGSHNALIEKRGIYFDICSKSVQGANIA